MTFFPRNALQRPTERRRERMAKLIERLPPLDLRLTAPDEARSMRVRQYQTDLRTARKSGWPK